jgi:hypothetical protein
MDAAKPSAESFNESQSFQVIREMIRISHRNMKNNGLLFILWGWTMVAVNLMNFVKNESVLILPVIRTMNVLGTLLGLTAVVFSLVAIFRQRKTVQTYMGISLRYVWFSTFAAMVLINLIEGNVLHHINFEFQHPVYMVLIAMATVITGGILRFRLILAGGVIFGLLALAASYLNLSHQLLLDALAWFTAFVIPGHYLYATRNRS